MNIRFDEVFARLGYDKRDYRTYVESGTAYGRSMLAALDWGFEVAHTVEMDPKRWSAASEKLFGVGWVNGAVIPEYGFPYTERERQGALCTCWNGDAAKVIPHLARSIAAPVVWHLDAHFCISKGTKEHAAKGSFPLWQELEAIRARNHADIVSVDDVHSFGKYRSDFEGIDSNPDAWIAVTQETLLEFIGDRVADSFVSGDNFIMALHSAPICGE